MPSGSVPSAGGGQVGELLLDVVDPSGAVGGVECGVFVLEPGVGLVVEGASVGEPLVGGARLVIGAFLASGAGVGPAGGFPAGQRVVLAAMPRSRSSLSRAGSAVLS